MKEMRQIDLKRLAAPLTAALVPSLSANEKRLPDRYKFFIDSVAFQNIHEIHPKL